MFVLAVNVDQQVAQRAQLGQRRVVTVDEGLAAPVGVEHAPDQALVVGVHFVVGEPGARSAGERQAEFERDLGAFAAGAQAGRVGAVAGGQPDRIEQNGFSGAGLPGQRGQPAVEVDLQAVDDREVADLDGFQH